MTRGKRRFGVRALAVLAVLGLMAFGAVGAPAENLIEPKITSSPGLFLVLDPGKFFEEDGLGETLGEGNPLTFEGEGEGPIRIVVPGRAMAIGCAGLDITEGELFGEVGHAKFTLLKCTVWAIKPGENQHEYILGEKIPCEVENDQISGKVKFVAILHEKETFVLIEALEGKVLKLVKFKAGTGCPLPLHTEITGSLGALILQLNSAPQLFTFSPAIQLLLGDKLLYGLFPAYYEGAATLTTTGPRGLFINVPWGAH